MSQPQRGNQNTSSKSGMALPKRIAIVLVVITILSLLVVGYSELTPHVMTLTQHQFVTSMQIVDRTYTVTNEGTRTVTSVAALTNTNLPAENYQYCGVYNCDPYAAPPGYTNFGCYPSGPYNTIGSYSVQCSGYLYIDGSGCTDLLVPVDDGFTNQIQQYYYLLNLPASHPSIGSWVTVTGQLSQQGSSVGPSGSACPASSIFVSSIS